MIIIYISSIYLLVIVFFLPDFPNSCTRPFLGCPPALPWALSMAVTPPWHHSAAPTHDLRPRKSMVQARPATIHAHTPTQCQPDGQIDTHGSTPCPRASAVVATLSSAVRQVLCHWASGEAEGRGEAEDRRSTHLVPARLTQPVHADPPTVVAASRH